MMYSPNVFTLDLEKLLAGDFDFSKLIFFFFFFLQEEVTRHYESGSANGVLAVTVYSATELQNVQELIDDEAPNGYIRFYVDHGQELDRTNVCEHSFTPAWNETRFLMLNNLHSLLSMELRTSRPGLKDRRLGTANFDLSKLDGDIESEQEELYVYMLCNCTNIVSNQ